MYSSWLFLGVDYSWLVEYFSVDYSWVLVVAIGMVLLVSKNFVIDKFHPNKHCKDIFQGEKNEQV